MSFLFRAKAQVLVISSCIAISCTSLASARALPTAPAPTSGAAAMLRASLQPPPYTSTLVPASATRTASLAAPWVSTHASSVVDAVRSYCRCTALNPLKPCDTSIPRWLSHHVSHLHAHCSHHVHEPLSTSSIRSRSKVIQVPLPLCKPREPVLLHLYTTCSQT